MKKTFLSSLHFASPVVTCYEGDSGAGGDAGGDVGAGAGTGDDSGAGASGGGSPSQNGDPGSKLFTQEQFNRALAEDRRKHQAALSKSEQRIEQLLSSQGISPEERDALESDLKQTRELLRSKEQQADLDKKKISAELTGKIEALQGEVSTWQGKYTAETIERSLLDAAKDDAWNASQFVQLLKPNTKLIEVKNEAGESTGEYMTVVEFQDVDADGKPTVSTLEPPQAVARMKELPQYDNLFKSKVSSGLGLNSGTGGKSGANGQVNAADLSTADYMAVRAKNPERLAHLQ